MRGERTVNLVRSMDSETYQIVSNQDMIMLRARDEVVVEKTRIDGKTIGFFYIRK